MSTRKKWRASFLYQIVALVIILKITITQFRFMSEDGCVPLPDASSSIFSLENSVSNTKELRPPEQTPDRPQQQVSHQDDIDDGGSNNKNNKEIHDIEERINKTGSVYNNISNSTTSEHVIRASGEPTGRFMSHPIYYRSPAELQSFHSTAHCIGDNFIENDSWKHKSCEFKNLCFDTESHDFVVFASPEQLELERVLSNRSLTHFSASSSMLDNVISIGGINPKWSKDIERMKWFPKLLDIKLILQPDSDKEGGVYVLPKNVVMVPFHSLAGMNVGHLLWDDWLPLYTILETFDYLDQKPLFIRYILKDRQWASCDFHRNVETCAKMMSKFLPLLGVGDSSSKNELWSIHDFNLTVFNSAPVKSRFVCGENGLAGLGMMTDHGKKLHGWEPKDYQTSHNNNRGGSLYRFRNYMMRNIGVSTAPLKHVSKKAKFKIVFSLYSSTIWPRRTNFKVHSSLLEKELGQKYDIDIVNVNLSGLNLVEQVELMSTTSILITVCGGGAISSLFLPKGAALFVFFNDEEGTNLTPARLDWDMLNNLGYIRTHWLPRVKQSKTKYKLIASTTGPQEIDLEAFVKLVDHELDIISHL